MLFNQITINKKSVQDALKKYNSNLISLEMTSEFTPSIYDMLPKSIKPIFTIKRMNRGMSAELKSVAHKVDALAYEIARGQIDGTDKEEILNDRYVKIQLVLDKLKFSMVEGWSNFYDKKGDLLEFSRDTFNLLPNDAIKEIAKECSRISGLSEEESGFLEL